CYQPRRQASGIHKRPLFRTRPASPCFFHPLAPPPQIGPDSALPLLLFLSSSLTHSSFNSSIKPVQHKSHSLLTTALPVFRRWRCAPRRASRGSIHTLLDGACSAGIATCAVRDGCAGGGRLGVGGGDICGCEVGLEGAAG
ncbi:hypothetical protein V495_00989, partial [Pseudogymnoascus sp. VKM F-4514 (FW-929)]